MLWNTASTTLGLGSVARLNDEKTEFLLIGTCQQVAKVSINTIRVGSVDVASAGKARDLDVWIDSKLTMSIHINKTCGAAFFYLYNICHIRKFLSKESTETLIHAFIKSKLDSCNSLFYGLPDSLTSKLQRIQNACARVVYSMPKFCHIMPLLQDLH